MEYDYLIKAILVGDSGVGKSSLLMKYVDDKFQDTYMTTIGVDFHIRTINIDSKVIKFQLWDTAGQDRFRSIVGSYYRGAHFVIVVFDITNLNSFRNVKYWLKEIERYKSSSECNNIILVGNKTDLSIIREVTYEDAYCFAMAYSMTYIETSAKDGKNVEILFENIAKQYLQNNKLQISEKANLNIHKTDPESKIESKSCC